MSSPATLAHPYPTPDDLEGHSVSAFRDAAISTRSPVGLWLSTAAYLETALTIAELEVRKLRHDPVEVFTRAVQPMLWLLVFSQVMNRTRAIDTGSVSYIDFLTPGVLAQSVLFVAIFYGIAVIWERDLGIVHKFIVSPRPARHSSSARPSPPECAHSPRS